MDLSSIFRFSDMLEYFPKILSSFSCNASYCSGKRCREGWSWDLFWLRHVSLKYQC